jgi:hypothetical protein
MNRRALLLLAGAMMTARAVFAQRLGKKVIIAEIRGPAAALG